MILENHSFKVSAVKSPSTENNSAKGVALWSQHCRGSIFQLAKSCFIKKRNMFMFKMAYVIDLIGCLLKTSKDNNLV